MSPRIDGWGAVIARDAKPDIARNGFAERTEVVGGDFFESVPAADLYLLKFILHDWDDESCVKILRKCREALEPGGRIAIFELAMGADGDAGLTALDGPEHACARQRTRALAPGVRRPAAAGRAATHCVADY